MKVSPRSLAIIYFIMGVLFTFIAIKSAEESMWNLATILIALVASLQFGVALRLMRTHFRLKNKNKKG